MLFIRHKWKGARRARAVLVPRHKESFRQLAQPASQPAQPVDRYFIFFQNITSQQIQAISSQPSPPSQLTHLVPGKIPASQPAIDQTGRQPRYFIFLQNSENTVFYIFTKYRAGPANPAGPASPRSLLLTLFCIFAKYSWPASPDSPPAWVFFIFTKYRILHFYKIQYFTFLQNTAPPASGPGTTADPAQPSQLASKHS